MRHTEGKWTVAGWTKYDNSEQVWTEAPDGVQVIAVLPGKASFPRIGPDGFTTQARKVTRENVAANARLIAEAPTMLEALRDLLQEEPCSCSDPDCPDTKARALIARIEQD